MTENSYWEITYGNKDIGLDDDVGTTSMSSKKNWKAMKRQKFKMYDDDGILYYKGYLYGDDADGFEPLDDFGMPNAGCVDIKYKSNNGEWESL
jgi:hypothetical protein